MSEPSSYTVWLNQAIQDDQLSQYSQPTERREDICTKNDQCKNPWCLDSRQRGSSWKKIHGK